MAISGLVVRSGIGSWGDIAHLITRGLDIGSTPIPPPLVYSGYPVRNYILQSKGIERTLSSKPYRERVLRGSPQKPRRLNS